MASAILTLVLENSTSCSNSMTTSFATEQVVVSGRAGYCWDDFFWLVKCWIFQVVILGNRIAKSVGCKGKPLTIFATLPWMVSRLANMMIHFAWSECSFTHCADHDLGIKIDNYPK